MAQSPWLRVVLISLRCGTMACQFLLNGGICRCHSLRRAQKAGFQSLFITVQCPSSPPIVRTIAPSVPNTFLLCSYYVPLVRPNYRDASSKAPGELGAFRLSNFHFTLGPYNKCLCIWSAAEQPTMGQTCQARRAQPAINLRSIHRLAQVSSRIQYAQHIIC